MSKSDAIFQKIRQKVEHFSERVSKSDTPSKVGKSVFKKGAPKSGAIFQKVCQKVEYFSKKCVKKWSTYENIRGFRGGCPELDAFWNGYTKCVSSEGHPENFLRHRKSCFFQCFFAQNVGVSVFPT